MVYHCTTGHDQEVPMTTDTVTPRILVSQVSDTALRADLERYQEMALKLGASDAVIIPTEWISVDERVRLKCLVPRCLRAGETPNCPPNAYFTGPFSYRRQHDIHNADSTHQ